MAAISFPSSPTLNQVHTVGQRSWKYNGTAWKLVPRTTDAVVEGSTNLYYTDARVASAPAVSALETRAGNIESAATTLAGRVTSAEGSITTLTSGLATEKGRVDAILNASQADKDSFAEIVTLINSVDTANDQAFAGYVLSNDAAVAAVASRATTLEEEMDAAEAAIATKVDASIHASDIGTLQGQITGIDARVVGLEFNLDGVTASRITDIETSISNHTGDNNNPHNVTKAQVGLGNVDNTSDANKPVSTAQQTALDGKQIKNVLSATAPSHVEGLVWIDTTDMSSYVSYGSAWVELDRV